MRLSSTLEAFKERGPLSLILFCSLLSICHTAHAEHSIWSDAPNLISAFPRIPIQITINNPYTIVGTVIRQYTTLDCTGTLQSTGFGNGSYAISSSGTYYLGLNGFTSAFHENTIRSIQAVANNVFPTSCIPITCSNLSTCQTNGGGPYTLTIAN